MALPSPRRKRHALRSERLAERAIDCVTTLVALRRSAIRGMRGLLVLMMLYDCVAHSSCRPMKSGPALVGGGFLPGVSPRLSHHGRRLCASEDAWQWWKRNMAGRQTPPRHTPPSYALSVVHLQSTKGAMLCSTARSHQLHFSTLDLERFSSALHLRG
jgi:hypothetical protein